MMNKRKNLLDLEYHTKLSERIAYLAFLGAGAIAIIVSNLSYFNKVSIMGMIMIFYFHIENQYIMSLNHIKKSIKEL